jgi:pimeloyl-ACP methyl ester carboxylesterase
LPWRQLVGDALAYGLPHARRARISGTGHLCNLGDADAFNALIADFVFRIEGGPVGARTGRVRADSTA